MLLTQRQVSGLLNVSIDTVKRLRKTGQLPTIKVGRSVRIPQGAAYTLMEERRWQEKNNRHAWEQTTRETITSITTQTVEASERAYGQTIYSMQKLVSQGGLKHTTKTRL